MRKYVSLLVALALAAPGAASAQSPDHTRFLRYAAVANDGTIAFTYRDDIWVANPDGSNPRRLTANIARDFQPRFSPDGKMVAFTSDRNGNNDVFVVPVTGGEPRQLTFMSGNDEAVSWTPDGKEVVFSTSRGAMQWGSPLYKVSLDGTIPRSLGMDMGRIGMIKQDATMVAFNRSLPDVLAQGLQGQRQRRHRRARTSRPGRFAKSPTRCSRITGRTSTTCTRCGVSTARSTTRRSATGTSTSGA